jgi:uncharacterized membrane protein YeaQ/YmgE (transglycosylase-associated protein family)
MTCLSISACGTITHTAVITYAIQTAGHDCREYHLLANDRRVGMDIQGLIIFLAIGAAAGWLAGTLMKGGGFGLLGNIIVGIIGAVIGGFVFSLLGISAGGLIGSIITATAGAALLLFVVGLVKKS